MVKLRVVIEHRLMPTSMKYALIHKGLEQLYYSLLFSSPGYKTSPQKWSQWLKMGFGVSIKEQPRAAARDDKLRFSTTSDGPKMELAITQGEDGVLEQLHRLLGELENLRKNVAGEQARVDACMALPSVKDELLQPMVASMEAEGLRPSDVSAFLDKAREAVGLLTEDTLLGVAVHPAASPAQV